MTLRSPPRDRVSLSFASIAAIVLLAAGTPDAASAGDFSFARDVRPILSEHCFTCHGPDAAARQTELRLDQPESVFSEINGTTIVSPGNPDSSELVARITAKDPDLVMPPPSANLPLSDEEIETIRQWIASGAAWEQHWSLRPLISPPVPQSESGWASDPIDCFIEARLRQAGLSPSDEASRRTLIRRVTLDLTGLPPTPEEVEQFLADDSPHAYARLVDRLLASPHYGERMAWDWLDAARYADSNGYQGDRERTMWPWRDWVVDAFNRNLPYDDFTVWQLAGDLLPDATSEQILATGFCRNHMINGEGGRIAEENRVDYVMDMTETAGTVWMGLTLNCCRCHDHKYDPLSNVDYYSLFAFFNQTPVDGGGGNPRTPPVLSVPSDDQQQQIDQLNRQIAELDRELKRRASEIAPTQPEWEQQRRTALQTGQWQWLTPDTATADHQQLTVLEDQSVLAGGDPADRDTYRVTASVPPARITAVRLEALQDPGHTRGGLSRADSSNFVLTGFGIRMRPAPEAGWMDIPIASAVATFEQQGHPVAHAFDGNSNTGWAVYEGRPVDRSHTAIFRIDPPVVLPENGQLEFTLRHDSVHVRHNIGRFRLSLTTDENPSLDDADAALRSALAIPADQRTPDQTKLIREAFLAADAPSARLAARREVAIKHRKSIQDQVPKVMVMADLPDPRPTYILDRGLYNQPHDLVSSAVPAVLPGLPDNAPANRLGLALWLVSDENPLTARVTVNRLWQQFFGRGLVNTVEDFGAQGEPPSHPELLDWLAADFRDSGWNVKRLVRQMVFSRTYRQSSLVTPDRIEHDPENRLLRRGPRYRLPSWMIRDQALAAAGLLTPSIGGKPVNVYQPPGVWEEATFGNKQYRQDHGSDLYRRSLYIFWRRIIAPTMFFDTASRQTCTVKVTRTNTPLHALLTWNDITFVEAARVLAGHVLAANLSDDRARLDAIFLRVLARPATEDEQNLLLSSLDRNRQAFDSDPSRAEELLAAGEAPRRDLSMPEHAAWTLIALAVLNLDETLSKE